MSRSFGTLLTAAAAGAGAYSLLRADEERTKDFEAVDGALGGWVSWAVEAATAVAGKTAAEVQMDSPPTTEQVATPATTVATTKETPVARRESAESRAGTGSGYPYQLSVEPNPAGGTARWRVRITCSDDRSSSPSATVDSKTNQEARVSKLMAGCARTAHTPLHARTAIHTRTASKSWRKS